MSLFALPGPQFLLAYLAIAAGLIVAVIVARRLLEAGPVPRLPHVDPYLIAYLRRGPSEAVRVTLLSLVDRGLVRRHGELVSAAEGAQQRARRPLEERVLSLLALPRRAHELSTAPELRAECEPLAQELRLLGLWIGPEHRVRRWVLALLAIGLLWMIAGTKISIALAAGRHNIGFLVALAVLSSGAVIALLSRPRTAVGDALLSDLRTLFAGLKTRADHIEPGGSSNELALLAGVFGVAALAGGARELAETLFPKAMRGRGGSPSDSGGGGCGTSCGSSSSCGGGGGCGGGGCGGGCGGCGS